MHAIDAFEGRQDNMKGVVWKDAGTTVVGSFSSGGQEWVAVVDIMRLGEIRVREQPNKSPKSPLWGRRPFG